MTPRLRLLRAGKKRDFRFQLIKEAVVEEPADITPWLHHLDEAMKEKVQQLQKTRWEEVLLFSSAHVVHKYQ